MVNIKQQTTRYGLAVLAAAAALFFRELLNPLLGAANSYHTLWLAVVFCAWYCGLGPSIVTIVIGSVGIWYWFLRPFNSWTGKTSTGLYGMLGFLAFSSVIVFWGEATRRITVRRQQTEEELRKTHEELEKAHEELESRVQERTAALEAQTIETAEKARLLDLANDAIFVKTAAGTISYWNKGAERLYGWAVEEALGRIPRELLHSEYPIPLEEIERGDTWQGEIRQTTREGRRIVVGSRWTTLRDEAGKPTGWMEINSDITGRRRAEDAARKLSGRLLTMQDEERRRIARGLHDSLGQYLTAAKMNLDLMVQAGEKQNELASQCSEILNTCLTETRTVSHLLHPPLLDDAGLGSAIRWYAEGFAERSSIQVNLDLPEELRRLPRETEIALFRTVQEGLTNVHRHSGSSAVDVRLREENGGVWLEVKDNGQGIPEARLRRITEGVAEVGVGIAGMRERVRQLGGKFEIQSDPKGTLLRVSLPLADAQRPAAVETSTLQTPAA